MEIILINHHRRKQKHTIDVAPGHIPYLLSADSFSYGGIKYTKTVSHINFPAEYAAEADVLTLTVYTDSDWPSE